MIVFVASAWAQQTCIEPMSLMQLGAELGEIEKSLDVKDINDVRIRLDRVTDRLPCLDDVIPANAWAEYARYMAVAFFFRQDEEQMLRWAQSSTWADPGLVWGPAFGPEHPMRRLLSTAEPVELGGPPDQTFLLEKDGAAFANGHFLARPLVPLDVPVFVQVFDGRRRRVAGFLQDGTHFPPDFLVPGTAEVPPPPWWGKAAAHGRVDPGTGGTFPVVPVVAGGALLAASGVTYLLAGLTAGGMDELGTSPELTAARTRVNLLVVASSVTLAGGLGVVGSGVLLSASGLTVRF